MVRDISGRSGAIVVGVVLLLGAVFVWICPCTAKEQSELERRLAALRAAGHPTSFTELTEREKIPVGVRNAAEVYKQASDAMVYPTPANRASVPVLGEAELPDLGTPLPEPMAEAIGAYLKRNEKCLSLLHESAGIEHCRYARDDHGETASFSLPRSLLQLLFLAAVYRADQGDSDAAVTYAIDALCLCKSLPDQPELMGHVMRISGMGLTKNGIERIVNATALTGDQLKRLDRACAGSIASLDITRALDTERCFMIERWTNPKLLADEHGFGLILIAPIAGEVLSFSLDYMDDCMEAVKLPLPERLARMDEIDKPLEEMAERFDEAEPTPQDPNFAKSIAVWTLPGVRRNVELDLFGRADLHSARTALAVQCYRLVESKLPESLEQLVPKYLDRVPVDPFDGHPLRYRLTHPGFVVYSIWWDGQDDGGVGKGDVKRGQPFDSPFVVKR